MKRIAFVVAALTAFAISGCPDPARDKAKATVTEAGGTTGGGTTTEGGIALSPSNTDLKFVGAKVTKKHEGTFGTFSGSVAVDNAIEDAVVSLEIDLSTVKTDTERLDGHLKSDDFFDVANHPTARFVTKSIVAEEGGDATHRVTGDLTLRGTTKSVSFPASISLTDDEFTMDAEFSIDRHQWNVSYKGQADDLIRDDVVITVQIAAPRAS